MSKNESGFIVNRWKWIIQSLGKRSIFAVINRKWATVSCGKGKDDFSEKWALGNFFLSIICLLFFPLLSTYVATIMIVYAAYRIFEIIVYHINIFLSLKELQGFRRSIILLSHNYIEVLFWFAYIYRISLYCFSKPFVTGSLSGSLYFSLVTMSTLGYGDIRPVNEVGRVIVSSQVAIGIFMGIFLVARFISLLPPRKTMDKEEEKIIRENQKETIRVVLRELEEEKKKNRKKD